MHTKLLDRCEVLLQFLKTGLAILTPFEYFALLE
jgi:hypothetical protein